MARILVVDDEPAIVGTVSYTLRREGHEVLTAADGELALKTAQRDNPDLVILDVMLPRLDGIDVCRALRASDSPTLRTVPIIMLSARAGEVDRVVGLEVGADDYIAKPFSMRELVARVKAALRRVELDRDAIPPAGQTPRATPSVVSVGDVHLDPGQRRAWRKKKELSLTPKEFDLLAFLLRSPRQAFTRDQLLEHVWGRDFVGDERTVDVHVRGLREKIEKNPSKPKLLETVRGTGYRIRPPKKDGKPPKATADLSSPAGAEATI